MVIQRIQSLYLLLAAVMMTVFTFFIPVGHIGQLPLMAYQLTGVLITASVAILIALIDIFLYKNLKFQIKMCTVAMFLTAATEAILAVCFYAMPEIEYSMPRIIWPVAVPVATFILLMLAHTGMRRDKRILSDSEHFYR